MSKIQKGELENRLAWSAHRAKTLGQCPLHYYWRYIGSWRGWEETSSPECQCSYRLKALTTPELEIGNLVHERIRTVFEKARAGYPVDPSTEIKNVQTLFEDFVEKSRQRRLETITAKRRRLLLHELGQDINATAMVGYQAQLARLLTFFFSFPDVKRLLKEPGSLLPEYLDPPGFELGNELGVPARPKTDVVFLEGDTVVVGDWKCGRPRDENRAQALVYALYVSTRMKLAPTTPLEVRFYYLADGEMETFRFSEEQKDEMRWQIGEDFSEFQKLSDHPLFNEGPVERFAPRVSRACYGCIFRLMCEPFLGSSLAKNGATL